MAKLFFSFLLVMFSVHLFAQTTTFTDDENTFSIEYPDTWKVKSDKFGKNRMVSFESPKTDEKQRRGDGMLALTYAPLEPGIKTLDDVLKTQLPKMKKELGVSAFQQNKRVNGKQVLLFSMSRGKESVKTKMTLWVLNGQLYTIMYAAAPDKYNTYLKDADAIASSFKAL